MVGQPLHSHAHAATPTSLARQPCPLNTITVLTMDLERKNLTRERALKIYAFLNTCIRPPVSHDHPLQHPWPESSIVPNVGRFLYTHVHSLHHKSYNTGPWCVEES